MIHDPVKPHYPDGRMVALNAPQTGTSGATPRLTPTSPPRGGHFSRAHRGQFSRAPKGMQLQGHRRALPMPHARVEDDLLPVRHRDLHCSAHELPSIREIRAAWSLEWGRRDRVVVPADHISCPASASTAPPRHASCGSCLDLWTNRSCARRQSATAARSHLVERTTPHAAVYARPRYASSGPGRSVP